MLQRRPLVTIADCRFGKGLFATQPIAAGETILEFRGRLIDIHQALAKGDRSGDPLQVTADRYLDLEAPGLYGNHSCTPNAGLRRSHTLVAIHPIGDGEEIFWDYSTSMNDGVWTMRCECGSLECRGIVDDFRTLPPALQRHYIALGIVSDFVVDDWQRTTPSRNAPTLDLQQPFIGQLRPWRTPMWNHKLRLSVLVTGAVFAAFTSQRSFADESAEAAVDIEEDANRLLEKGVKIHFQPGMNTQAWSLIITSSNTGSLQGLARPTEYYPLPSGFRPEVAYRRAEGTRSDNSFQLTVYQYNFLEGRDEPKWNLRGEFRDGLWKLQSGRRSDPPEYNLSIKTASRLTPDRVDTIVRQNTKAMELAKREWDRHKNEIARLRSIDVVSKDPVALDDGTILTEWGRDNHVKDPSKRDGVREVPFRDHRKLLKLANLPLVHSVWFEEPKMADGWKSLQQIGHIRELHMYYPTAGFSALAKGPRIDSLDIRTGDPNIVCEIAELDSVQSMRLVLRLPDGVSPAATIKPLSKMKNLKVLYIGSLPKDSDGDVLVELSALDQLEELELSNYTATEAGVRRISSMQKLKRLTLCMKPESLPSLQSDSLKDVHSPIDGLTDEHLEKWVMPPSIERLSLGEFWTPGDAAAYVRGLKEMSPEVKIYYEQVRKLPKMWISYQDQTHRAKRLPYDLAAIESLYHGANRQFLREEFRKILETHRNSVRDFDEVLKATARVAAEGAYSLAKNGKIPLSNAVDVQREVYRFSGTWIPELKSKLSKGAIAAAESDRENVVAIIRSFKKYD